jgi:lysyl-tRNA synthetase class I
MSDDKTIAVPELISCEKCGKVARPSDQILRKPDGSKWIHYRCKEAHRFHRTIAGALVRFADCDCSVLGLLPADRFTWHIP